MKSKGIESLQRQGYDIYTINDQIVVDQVCLYENLETDLENVRLRLGIPEKIALPKAKTEARKGHRGDYREIIDEELRYKIADAFKKEIELFNYSW